LGPILHDRGDPATSPCSANRIDSSQQIGPKAEKQSVLQYAKQFPIMEPSGSFSGIFAMRYRLSSLVLLPLLVAVVFACSDSSLFGQSSSVASGVRDWKDVSGNHTIRAQFVGVIDRSKVALKTEDGKEMTIELSRLSNVDIYQAVKSDLLAKLSVAAPVSSLPAGKKVQSPPRNKFQPSSRKAQPSSRRAQPAPAKARTSAALPVSKPRPTVDDDLVVRVEEFIETLENEDTETIFQTILYPTGLVKFEKEKKARLLTALQSIDYKSIERKPGGKYQFQTDSSPISFKKLNGIWYLRN